MMIHSLPIFSVIAAALVAGACTSPNGRPAGALGPNAGSSGALGPERAERVVATLNLSGFPPEYRRGFVEGCAKVGGPAVPVPAGEPSFRQGYRDGNSYCQRRPPS
jgi:hypothetical protein